MNDMIFALISPKKQQITQSELKLRELTIAWSRYGYHGPLIENDSIDKVLSQALNTPYRYCLIQQSGHVIDEQWYLPHWDKKGFYDSLNVLMKNKNFLVIGQWQSGSEDCVGLQSDCLLVDLYHYQQLGQPIFGEVDHQKRDLMGFTVDHNNPDRLEATSIKKQVLTDCEGWNFIQLSHQHDLALQSFGEDINQCRFNLSDDQQKNQFTQVIGKIVSDIEMNKRLNDQQGRFFSNIKKQLKHAQKGIFLLNIEPYHDVV